MADLPILDFTAVHVEDDCVLLAVVDKPPQLVVNTLAGDSKSIVFETKAIDRKHQTRVLKGDHFFGEAN